VAVTVCDPAVVSVTEKFFVPATSAAFDGSVALASEEVIATVGVADDTTFQFASTALTVTVTADPAVAALGDPVLPVDVPGAAVSPGRSAWSLVTVPELMVNAAESPVALPPVSVAVTVCDEPARISVTACEARTPELKADVVPLPAENSDVEVMSTVPANDVTVRLPESCAVTFTLNDVPAVCVLSAEPSVAVTAKWSSAPKTVTAEEAVLSALVYAPDDVFAATLNV